MGCHRLVFLRFLLATLSLIQPAQATTITGKIVAIADGDTLTILDGTHTQHKIRIVGIDAPEKRQDFGQRSKTNLSDMAFNQSAVADCRKIDRYKRNLCVVSVARRDVGLEQIRAGMAWHYKQYAKEQPLSERGVYERAENEAKARRLGLWVDVAPVPPWEWRHKR